MAKNTDRKSPRQLSVDEKIDLSIRFDLTRDAVRSCVDEIESRLLLAQDEPLSRLIAHLDAVSALLAQHSRRLLGVDEPI